MINGLPRSMSNNLLSLSFLNLDNSCDYNFISIYDYVDDILTMILNTPKIEILSRKIPEYFIIKIIILSTYFNSNRYKANTIMEKFLYIIYYFIQDRRNLIYLYQNKYDIIAIDELKDIKNYLVCIKPIIENLLILTIDEINEYLKESRNYVYEILKIEMENMPTDLIRIIVSYMSDENILMFIQIF